MENKFVEDKTSFLSSRLNTNVNQYTDGKLPVKEQYREIYINKFAHQQQFLDGIGGDVDIIKLTTKEDFIVDNKHIYVIFVGGVSSRRIKGLKFHITQNFIANWMPYPDYMRFLDPDSFNGLTINTLTGEEVYAYSFNQELMDISELFSDIEFLILEGNTDSYRRGFFDAQMIEHLLLRCGKGLVTIILYTASKTNYDNNNYESRLRPHRDIVTATLKLTKEEKALAKKDKIAYESTETQEPMDLNVDPLITEKETLEYRNQKAANRMKEITGSVDPFIGGNV